MRDDDFSKNKIGNLVISENRTSFASFKANSNGSESVFSQSNCSNCDENINGDDVTLTLRKHFHEHLMSVLLRNCIISGKIMKDRTSDINKIARELENHVFLKTKTTGYYKNAILEKISEINKSTSESTLCFILSEKIENLVDINANKSYQSFEKTPHGDTEIMPSIMFDPNIQQSVNEVSQSSTDENVYIDVEHCSNSNSFESTSDVTQLKILEKVHNSMNLALKKLDDVSNENSLQSIRSNLEKIETDESSLDKSVGKPACESMRRMSSISSDSNVQQSVNEVSQSSTNENVYIDVEHCSNSNSLESTADVTQLKIFETVNDSTKLALKKLDDVSNENSLQLIRSNLKKMETDESSINESVDKPACESMRRMSSISSDSNVHLQLVNEISQLTTSENSYIDVEHDSNSNLENCIAHVTRSNAHEKKNYTTKLALHNLEEVSNESNSNSIKPNLQKLDIRGRSPETDLASVEEDSESITVYESCPNSIESGSQTVSTDTAQGMSGDRTTSGKHTHDKLDITPENLPCKRMKLDLPPTAEDVTPTEEETTDFIEVCSEETEPYTLCPQKQRSNTVEQVSSSNISLSNSFVSTNELPSNQINHCLCKDTCSATNLKGKVITLEQDNLYRRLYGVYYSSSPSLKFEENCDERPVSLLEICNKDEESEESNLCDEYEIYKKIYEDWDSNLETLENQVYTKVGNVSDDNVEILELIERIYHVLKQVINKYYITDLIPSDECYMKTFLGLHDQILQRKLIDSDEIEEYAVEAITSKRLLYQNCAVQ